MSLAHYRSDIAIYQAGKVLAAEFTDLMDRGKQGPDDILNVLFRCKNYERFRDVQPIVKKLSHVKMDDHNDRVWRSAIKSCMRLDLERWGEFAELIDLAHAAWLDQDAGLSLHDFIIAHPKMLEKLGFSLRQSKSSGVPRSGLSVTASQGGHQRALVSTRKELPSCPPTKRPPPKQKSLGKLRTVQITGVLTPRISSQSLAANTRTSSAQRGGGSPNPQQRDKPVIVPAPKRAESSLSRMNSSTSLSTAAASSVSSRPANPASTATSRSVSPAKGPTPVSPPTTSRKGVIGSTLRDRFQRDKMLAAAAASEGAVLTLPLTGTSGIGAVGSRFTTHHSPRQLRRMPKPGSDQRVPIAV